MHDDDEDEEEEEQPAHDADQYRRMALGVRARPKTVRCHRLSETNSPRNSRRFRRHAPDAQRLPGPVQNTMFHSVHDVILCCALQNVYLSEQVNDSVEKASPPARQYNSVSNRRSSYAEDEEAASGSEADEDARRAAVAVKNAAIAAMLEPAEMAELDDEVERILLHRCAHP